MHILIAPNAFKHSLDAGSAAAAIAEGLEQSRLQCTTECFPVGDGGDGTASLIIEKLKGEIITGEVHDAYGKNIIASYGLIDNKKTAVIEMANASGLRILKDQELDPLKANTYGTGEQIKQALDLGVKKIIIGLGGSATVDGGVGILASLGVRFLDKNKKLLEFLPANLIELEYVDISCLDKRISQTEIIVLCDVENFLLGEEGAAAVFGPQKGATPKVVHRLEQTLQKFSVIAKQATGKEMDKIKHGGTAGGAAAALYAFLDARLVNGIDYFLTLTGFDNALKNAGLVITGEGSIDDQTLQGKGPFGVAKKAKEKNLPVIGIAGKVPLQTTNELEKYFDALWAIASEPSNMNEALKNTEANLIRTSKAIGNLLHIAPRR